MAGDDEFTFVVLGRAAPQGSKELQRGKDGKPYLVESSKRVHPWRKLIMRAAKGSDGRPLATFAGPVEIHIEFEFRRAKSNTDPFPTVSTIGDGDKLTRAVWDALTQAGVIQDDAYCVDWSGSKRYAEEDRTYITVRPVRGYSVDRMPQVVDGPIPTPPSFVEFASKIGVTLDSRQGFIIDEVFKHTVIEPKCCNAVDHKSCNMFGEDTNCPCPTHCTA